MPGMIFGSHTDSLYDSETTDFSSVEHSGFQSPTSLLWLESLPADPQLAMLDHELGSNLECQKPGSEKSNTDSSMDADVPQSCRGPGSCKELPDIIQALGRLHQQMARARRRTSPDSEGSALLPTRSTLGAINELLTPGKELIDLVCELCQRCTQEFESGMCYGFIDDQRTVFGLIKAPILQLLHTYNDILLDIAVTGTEDRYQLDIIRTHFQHLSGKFAYTASSTNTIETFDLSLGQLGISRSLQLKIIVSVLRDHIATSPGLDETKWLQSRSEAAKWAARMNIREKVAIVTGSLTGTCMAYVAPVESVGFSGLCIQDGPAAIRLAAMASVFPSGLTMAATWDRELIYQRGEALGAEFRGSGAHVMLGPVGGPLGRSAMGGRNWEGFSPDPYLTGVAMQLTVRGVQSQGVQANAKHFIGNEQETQRKATEIDGQMVDAISANIDDRTLHELYLWPFADAVRAGVASVTCAYNRVNGTYSCQSKRLLTDILKGELGFEGFVVSDYMAAMSGAETAIAGMDMNQPGPISGSDLQHSYWGPNLVKAVADGSVPEARVDDMVRRVLTPYLYLGQNLTSFPTVDPSSTLLTIENFGFITGTHLLNRSTPTPPGRDVRGNHAALIRQMGSAGTVLLKNVNGTLPLSSPRNIGVFGEDAADVTTGALNPNAGYDVGTVIIGGGSGGGRTSSIVPPLEAIKARARKTGAQLQYITNTTLLTSGEQTTLYPWPDVCLVFLKTWETEGVDRTDLEADGNSAKLVDAVAALCPKRTVVITHSGCPNIMPWADNPDVVAILAAHYPGEESGNSIVDVLWGDVNPSGRLPYTVAANASDYNAPIVNITGPEAADGRAWQDNFTEGLYIDYRHFDKEGIAPLYEFGYGLSYTTFALASELDLSLVPCANNGTVSALPPAARNSSLAMGGSPSLWENVVTASVSVKNTGNRAGSTVVQLYMTLPPENVPPGTPIRVLRGFEKVPLKVGETKKISFELTRRDISYWDVEAQDWRIPGGEMMVSVGFSSRDLPISRPVTVV
ncbi:hypothetical protein V2A60_002925 [Cordyceps javanica]